MIITDTGANSYTRTLTDLQPLTQYTISIETQNAITSGIPNVATLTKSSRTVETMGNTTEGGTVH